MMVMEFSCRLREELTSLQSISHPKFGVLTVIPYRLNIFIVKVGQANNEMYNVL